MNLLTRIELVRALTPSEMDLNFSTIEKTINEISDLIANIDQVEIVNDLTAGGATKAASADTVKMLDTYKYPKISNGTGKISSIESLETLVGLGFSLAGSALYSADFSGSDVSGGDFSGARFSGCTFDGTYLSNCNLSYSVFDTCSFAQTYFTGASIVGADFSGSTGLDTDINVAFSDIDINPNGINTNWNLIWADGSTYECDYSSGEFTELI